MKPQRLFSHLAILFLIAVAAYGQGNPDCQWTDPFTSATGGTFHQNTSTPCVAFRVTYQAVGMTALSIQIEGGQTSTGPWTIIPSSAIVQGTNPMTDANSSTLVVGGTVYYPYIRLEVTVFTPTGASGTITARTYGYKGTSAAADSGAFGYFVPYTGAVADVNLNGHGITAGSTSTDGTPSTDVRFGGAGNGVYGSILPTSPWDRKGPLFTFSSTCDGGGGGEAAAAKDTNSLLLGLAANIEVVKLAYTGAGGICYRESLDGKTNWVARDSALIAGYARSWMLIPAEGGTIYLYAVPYPAQNQIDLYTSTDHGATFTLAQAAVIGLGTAGQWDDTVIANSSFIVDATNIKATYEAASTTGDWKSGSAHSTGVTDFSHFTKDAGNPKMGQNGIMSASAQSLWKDPATGYYWDWAHVSFPGLGHGDLPTDGARFSSTDFVTWTMNPPYLTLPRLTYLEGARNLGGQIADPNLIEFNGQTIEYYSTTVSQSVGPAQIMYAVAPMTMHQLVQTDEGATVSYESLSLQPGSLNNYAFADKASGGRNLTLPNCSTYVLTGTTAPAGGVDFTIPGIISEDCNLIRNATYGTWTSRPSGSVANDGNSNWSYRGGFTALTNTNASGTDRAAVGRHQAAATLYDGDVLEGYTVGDTYVGKDAATDDWIIAAANTAVPPELLRVKRSTGAIQVKTGLSGTGAAPVCVDANGNFYRGNNSGIGAPCP